MRVLFLTIGKMDNVEEYALYPDLMRQFRDHGHEVYIVSANERRVGKETTCVVESGIHVLRVRIGNITKCGIVEKGISTIMIEQQYKRAINAAFPDVTFDLVLYSTPPITLAGVVEYIKKRDHAETYLLLKDIFPQNAVDIGMMSKSGIKGLLYSFFRKKEKHLYALSDRIGCMSEANVQYVIDHNPQVDPAKVEVCPNCIEVRDLSLGEQETTAMREKYGIPLDKPVFVYGGNLGKPQGIPFLIDCLKTQLHNTDAFFLIVGDGTEFSKLHRFFEETKPTNMKLMRALPKEDYDRMVAACDVGMIFLDHRFTIPNFPSRLLSYMQAKLPVLACTDPNTDIGKVIVEGEFGWWCESNDPAAFSGAVNTICQAPLEELGQHALCYLQAHYSAEHAYQLIVR